MRDQQTHSLLRIVSSLEDALNNTSIILQFDTGTRRLLFPGDAQIENWSYCLTAPAASALRADLGAVDLYKVGHRRQPERQSPEPREALGTTPRPFVAQMSTLSNVHGETKATAVPRATLVHALEALGPLHSTDGLDTSLTSTAVTASTRIRLSFIPVG